jgi:hypothetical protein
MGLTEYLIEYRDLVLWLTGTWPISSLHSRYFHVYPRNVTIIMGSRFDNLIYWIISRVITMVHCYTFTIAVSMRHRQLTLKVNIWIIELPWTMSSWRILESFSLWLLNWTAPYIGLAWTTHRRHINCSATDIMYCCQACPPIHCLAIDALLVHIHCCDIFTGMLLSNGRHSIVGWALVGTYLPRNSPIHIAASLRLFVLISLSACHRSFFSKGCACDVCAW